MLRGKDVRGGNLWVEDVTVVPARLGHHGGVSIAVFKDKNRTTLASGSITLAARTYNWMDMVPVLEDYCSRMGFDLARPPPRTALFPRLDNDGRPVGRYYTAKQVVGRLRFYLRLAGVPMADKYGLSGFRPGGHTDMLIDTGGDHEVSDGIGRWDSVAAERLYDRRNNDMWLIKMNAAGVGPSATAGTDLTRAEAGTATGAAGGPTLQRASRPRAAGAAGRQQQHASGRAGPARHSRRRTNPARGAVAAAGAAAGQRQ
jgi:hypothetical protein